MNGLDTAKVWAVTVGAVTIPTMAKLTDVAQFAAALAALGYTIWKWRRSAKSKPRRHEDTKED